jgi:lipid-A-disaccharide synthase
MTGKRFLLIAGETSGDLLAAELVAAIRRAESSRAVPFPAQFFGAGGPQMQAAGVDVVVDMTRHSVIGLWEAVRKLGDFKRLFDSLLRLACERQPDVILCVDFSGFNRRFAHAVRGHVRAHRGSFRNWDPRIVQYVSPQVWASRPGRADALARDVDLLLCLLPFEKAWYAARVPRLRVEFVGHPIVERHLEAERGTRNAEWGGVSAPAVELPRVLLLSGSRRGELSHHLPAMVGAVQRILETQPGVRFRMVLPNEELRAIAQAQSAAVPNLEIQVGGLSQSLQEATLAVASTGTVTLECALFGVPTVALYRTSWPTYFVARSIATVKFLAMPNLLAGKAVFPELIQHQATPQNIAREALTLLASPDKREAIKAKLAQIVASLGGPGASDRAAAAVLCLMDRKKPH